MKILFFDLETTGLLPNRHGIHQIGGEITINGEVQEKFDFKVRPNPKAEISDKALEIAGVSLETISNYQPMEEVFAKFIEMLDRYVDRYDKSDKFFLAGYNNTSFDNNFLRGWFLQNGDKYFGSWFWSNTIDVMTLATQHLLSKRSEMENFRLRTVAKTMGIEIEEEKLHDASYDIYLTKEIYDRVTRSIQSK